MKARIVLEESGQGARLGIWLAMLALATTALAQAPPLLITEFKAVNNGPLFDDDRTFSDWIEIHNPTAQDVDLLGWSLTDWRGNLQQWTFPSTNLAPGGFLLVHASARDRRIPGRTLHTNFRLSAGGEYLALVRPDGLTIATEFTLFPPQTAQFSYGFYMSNGQVRVERPAYLMPTPGQPNPDPAGVAPTIALTELMYHPSPPPDGSLFTADDFEFIELRNTGTNVLNLAGMTFGYGIEFTFGAWLLDPGARVLVVRDEVAATLRYGGGLPIAGEFRGTLQDSSERLALLAPDGSPVFDFEYSDQWARMTDGLGFSLVPVDETNSPPAYGQSSHWRASARNNGSAGLPDPPSTVPSVRINEVLTRTAAPYEDAIELFNPTADDVDISGWFLTDDFNAPKKFRLPRGAVVPAGSFLALDEHAFNTANDDPTSPGFGLSDFGEEVYLVSADAEGILTGWAHGFGFGTAERNVPYIRHVISTGEEHFVAEDGITFFATNAGPKVGPIVISEIHYQPPARLGGDDTQDEFIKLHNLTDAPVPLYDPAAPTNTWVLQDSERGSFGFLFPTGAVLAARGFAIVVGFDLTIASNAMQLVEFTNRLGLEPGTPVFGPWNGTLNNAGGAVDLLRPDPPEPFILPYILLDHVRYSATAPWPETANGTGASIQRIHNAGYGNEPTNWWAATPSPSRAGDPPPRFIAQPADVTVSYAGGATFTASAVGALPISYQWRFHGVDIPGATNPALNFNAVLPPHQGAYACFASNIAHTALSRTARLTISDNSPPALTSVMATPLRVSTNRLVLTGTASDDAIVASVFGQVNSDSPSRAEGTNSWELPVTLRPGFNTVVTYAVDWRGNRSAFVTNVILFEDRPARLGLRILGSGTVSGAAHGQRLELGRSYTLRAIPRPGHRFQHWLDWESGQTSTNLSQPFVMTPQRTFTAVFEPGPYISLAGDYNGLFYNPTNPGHLNAGFISFTVTPRGGYSGFLMAHGARRPFSGVLNEALTGNARIRLASTNVLNAVLAFVTGSDAAAGEVYENRFASQLYARRRGIATNDPLAQYVGRYTATLTATADAPPARQRSGAVTLTAAGLLKFTGRLPDGTAVARDVSAGVNGQAPFYLAPYAGRGSVFGWLSVTNSGTNSLRGTLLWNRSGPQAFTNGIDLRAHR